MQACSCGIFFVLPQFDMWKLFLQRFTHLATFSQESFLSFVFPEIEVSPFMYSKLFFPSAVFLCLFSLFFEDPRFSPLYFRRLFGALKNVFIMSAKGARPLWPLNKGGSASTHTISYSLSGNISIRMSSTSSKHIGPISPSLAAWRTEQARRKLTHFLTKLRVCAMSQLGWLFSSLLHISGPVRSTSS